ncbi:MAG TPA: methyltransferase domain-containing protein, partial [Acidimicrobiales bacterium]|nr:methyltransferase domain-containing protein [Acidimicrobiales bacterium]
MDPDVVEHYSGGEEQARLDGWSLERLRTEAVIAKMLPAPPARVLDVGGGPGRYSAWMTRAGWRVTLLDPVPLHVAQASAAVPGRVECGDGRALPHPNVSFDAVLVLGPLYHLPDRDDRVAVLQEAARVVRPGGVVVAAAISRLASVLDGFARGFVVDPEFQVIVAGDLATGTHHNPERRPGWFTTAYFHRPADLAAELRDSGLGDVRVVGVEGPAWLWGDRGREPGDEEWRRAALWAADLVEEDDDFIPMSAHLLGIARRPD